MGFVWWGETTSVMAGVESHYRETQRPDLFLRRNGGVSREKVQRDTLSLHVGVFLWTSAAWNARNMSPWENAALEDADLLYIHRKYQYRRGQLWNHWTEKSTTEQPCTLVVQPCTLVVQPCTLVVQPCTLVVQPCSPAPHTGGTSLRELSRCERLWRVGGASWYRVNYNIPPNPPKSTPSRSWWAHVETEVATEYTRYTGNIICINISGE